MGSPKERMYYEKGVLKIEPWETSYLGGQVEEEERAKEKEQLGKTGGKWAECGVMEFKRRECFKKEWVVSYVEYCWKIK